jgi:teichoic acid transport system permease protein
MSTSVQLAGVPPGMRDAHEAEQLRPYLSDLRSRQNYIWYVATNELKNRQVNTVLGNLWHLLNPALTIGVYYLIFGLLLKTTRGVDNFILFITIGLFLFQYTQKATIDGANSIVNNSGLIKAIRFPRALLPVTSTVTETLSLASAISVTYIVAVMTREPIAFRWLLLPLVLAVMFVFNLGAAMLAARLTTHFRDTTQILPFVFRLLLYASGVIFSVEAYTTDNPVVRWLFVFNPLYCYVSIGRWCLMGGDLDGALVVSGLVWCLVMLVAGFTWFRAAEERYARD